jgi:hypothetical protein
VIVAKSRAASRFSQPALAVASDETPASEPGARLANAIHRVLTKGLSPEQAVDDAIARSKRILNK